MHLTSSPIDWYAARAAGIAAYIMLTTVVALGLALASRAPGRRWRRWPMFAVEDVHRTGGLLVGTFIALHVATIAVDSFMPFTITQLAVPLAAGYRPIWTALGIVSAELLLALAITDRYRGRLGFRRWRMAHYANFAVWGAATLHGIGTGTDRNAPWMLAVYAVSVVLVGGLTVWRMASRRGVAVSAGRTVTVLLAAAAGLVVLAMGPLGVHRRPWNAAEFQDTLRGKIIQQAGSTVGLVSMSGVGHGSQSVLVRADLLVGPAGLRATTFQLEYLPSGTLCTGRVTSVRSYGFTGECGRGPGRRVVEASWRPGNSGAVIGRLAAHG
jgi:sulfoxide reductase heme-binding subunit YedZ